MVSLRRITVSAVALLVLVACRPFAQEHRAPSTADTSAEVPALQQYHTVIYKIWHTAWPNQDDALLTSLVPDVRKGADAIAAAGLPGILRDKEAEWKAGVDHLLGVVADYERAAAAKNKQELLDAAEKLHSGYESLVRIIRPPLKELESFHSQLYVLYHYYMPKDTLAGITSAVKELKVRMVSLNNAALPSRLKGKQEAFERARVDLSTSLDALAATLPSNDLAQIKPAVEKMHGCYEALAKVLE